MLKEYVNNCNFYTTVTRKICIFRHFLDIINV